MFIFDIFKREARRLRTVSVVMAELAEDMREGLLALAVGAGFRVMAAVMEQDVTAVCGPTVRGEGDSIASTGRLPCDAARPG